MFWFKVEVLIGQLSTCALPQLDPVLKPKRTLYKCELPLLQSPSVFCEESRSQYRNRAGEGIERCMELS